MAEPASGKLPDPFESVEVDSVKDDPVTAGEMTTLRQIVETTTTTVQAASKDPFDDDSDFPPELTEKAAKPAPARDPFVETPDPLREAASVAVFEPVKEPAAPALVVPNAALNSELADAEMPLLAEPVTGGLNKRQKHWVDRLSKGFMYVAIVFGVIAGIVAIVLYSIKEVEASTVSVCVAGLCAFTCFALTAIQVALHLSVYSNPAQQRLIVRIILMCPIYAIDSFIGLVAYRYASVVNLVRDSYESYVIYMFFNLLLSYLGGEEAILRNWADSQPTMEHLPPFCFLPHVKLNAKTLNWWKFFLLQYTILNPFFTLLAIPLYFTDNYHEGEFSLASPYAWFSGIKFISVTFAFTSLVYFFFGTKQFYGEGVNPMPKFAAIKAVVFFSFWQTVLLAGLNHFSVVPHSGNWTADEVATGLGNFVLCIEMFIIAVAHRWIFTDKPYHTAEGRQSLRAHHVRHVFAVSDVIKDAKKIVKQLTPMGADEPSAV